MNFTSFIYTLNGKFLNDNQKSGNLINGIAEIIGYSPSKNIHIVINDGQCRSQDNKWLVNIYKVNDYHMDYFINYRPKYLDNDFKIFEGWVDFESNIKQII